MQKFGCAEGFTHLACQLHDGRARITDYVAASETFAVTNGVKQGCVLTPTLFSFMVSAMLMDVYRVEGPGIGIVYRADGRLLNSLRMQAPMRHGAAYANQSRELNHAHLRCLRRTVKLRWHDRTPTRKPFNRPESSASMLRRGNCHYDGAATS
ncbi:hypothetical protein SprV_0602074200 [Sparganum proliferum]